MIKAGQKHQQIVRKLSNWKKVTKLFLYKKNGLNMILNCLCQVDRENSIKLKRPWSDFDILSESDLLGFSAIFSCYKNPCIHQSPVSIPHRCRIFANSTSRI